MKRTLVMLAVLQAAASETGASYQICPDAPARLTTAAYLPWQVLTNDGGAYSVALQLPAGTQVDALHNMDSGEWLFSVAAPTTLGGTTYDPRDVIRRDGGGLFSLFLDGAGAGIPDGADVDAIFLDGGDTGDPILSFAVPTTIGGTTYMPADLVRDAGGVFSLYFDSSAAVPPVPVTSNLTGAAQTGALIVMAFDVPTRVGSDWILPGDLVSWNGAAFARFELSDGWPISSYVNALAGITCGPEVCDGQDSDCDGILEAAEADADGDGFRGCGGDCDDTNAAISPAALELCDGLDNDCSGVTDDLDADGDDVTMRSLDRSPSRGRSCSQRGRAPRTTSAPRSTTTRDRLRPGQ